MTKPIILYSRMWRSGTGLYAQGLAQGLAETGSLVFVAPRADEEWLPDRVERLATPREYIETDRVPTIIRAWRSLYRILSGSVQLLYARKFSRDVIATITEPLIFWLPLSVILKLTGARVVFVCHDPKPHAYRLPRALWRIEHAAHGLNYRLAWRIVVLAHSGKEALTREFSIAPERISVVPHGLLPAPEVKPAPGDRILLVFGTIRRNKQVHIAIRALAAARAEGLDVRLIVAGAPDPNDPGYLKDCREAAAAAGGAVRLMIGFVDDSQLAKLFSEVDALLLPYVDFESQSGVAVLAGLTGRALICAAAGGIPDLVDAGLVTQMIDPPVGEEEVKNAILAFYASPAEEWRDRTERGRQSLKKALAWPEISRQIRQLFA